MQSISYTTSILTFYLKGELSLDRNFLVLKNPNTLLKLIPLGTKTESIPVDQLSSVSSNFKLRFGTLLKGFILAAIGLYLLTEYPLLGLLLSLVGVNTGITAFETVLLIRTTSASGRRIPFLIFERDQAALAEAQIRGMISDRLDDTNNRVQTDRIVAAINNK